MNNLPHARMRAVFTVHLFAKAFPVNRLQYVE